MGRVKNEWIESQEYSERTGLVSGIMRGEKYVCADLSDDPYVHDYILQHGRDGVCSYSGRHSKVIDIVDLAEWVIGKIKQYFHNPDEDGLYLGKSFYDDDEEVIPGWQRINGYVTRKAAEYYDSTASLLYEYGFSNRDDLTDDISGLIANNQWINIDSFDLREDEQLLLHWNRFAEKVKVQKGYTPTNMKTYIQAVADIGEQPFDMVLDDIRCAIMACRLLRTIPCHTHVYRCRNIKDKTECQTFEQITSAPSDFAFANRMSAAGDSMFYAAFIPEVSLVEAVDKLKPIKALGEFSTKKDLLVVDLTGLPHPSLWGDYDYLSMKFLHDFSMKVSENFDDYTDKQKETEYIPTQVFTNSIRKMKDSTTGIPIDGIVYYSSKIKGEKNVVIFCNQEESKKFVCLNQISYQ